MNSICSVLIHSQWRRRGESFRPNDYIIERSLPKCPFDILIPMGSFNTKINAMVNISGRYCPKQKSHAPHLTLSPLHQHVSQVYIASQLKTHHRMVDPPAAWTRKAPNQTHGTMGRIVVMIKPKAREKLFVWWSLKNQVDDIVVWDTLSHRPHPTSTPYPPMAEVMDHIYIIG